MSYNKKKLAACLADIVANATSDVSRLNPNEPFSIIGGAGLRVELTSEDGRHFAGQTPDDGDPAIIILEQGVRAQTAFVDECLKDAELATQVGAEAVLKQVQTVVQDVYGAQDSTLDLEEIVKDHVLKPLRAEIRKWCVRVPISNLRFNLAEALNIGRVRIVRHQDGLVANIKAIMGLRGSADEARSVSDKAAMLSTASEISSQGTAWAVCEVDCHQKRVKEAAREQVETAINVLRAFTHVFYGHSTRCGFGLPYEVVNGRTGFFAESDSGITIQTDSRGFPAPFDLTDAVLLRLKEDLFFDELARIAGTEWERLNSFEKAIRTSYQWLGRSVIALTNAESFTQCTIAIERLLILDGEETTVERFADRLTYLLSSVPEDRKRIHKLSKRLYDVRSKIVHAGFAAVEIHQVAEIELLAVNALLQACDLLEKISDHNGLRDLLHDLKMA